jgi:hypothetical protein
VNKKQIVVTGLKDMVIPVVIFSTCITWMIVRREELTKTLTFQTIVEFFKYVLEQLKKIKQHVKMTSMVAGKLVKDSIALNGTVSCFFQHDFGGNKIWI